MHPATGLSSHAALTGQRAHGASPARGMPRTRWVLRSPHDIRAVRIGRSQETAVDMEVLTTPTGTYPGSFAFAGGVLLPDGQVFCIPFGTTSARIYDPRTDTLTTPSGTYPGSLAFAGGVLLPDGRVFCVPRSSTSARIYDPRTDTLTTPTGTYPGNGAFLGGVLLPDGRVFCVPYNSTSALIAGGGGCPLTPARTLSALDNKL